MATSAPHVVGVELCKAATEDAVRNARANNIGNVHFINSKVRMCAWGYE
jgi:tRNA/tmRNA/rRNA uracil-C5-methylase (TrmA/RlmC/RlmD family)